MPHPRPELTTSYYEPKMKDLCICGSGLKFKRCCFGKYSSESINKYREYFNEGNYKKALEYARRHFTWYALAHKAHTLNLIKADKQRGLHLLNIDINALAELLENIGLCYHHLGIGKSYGDVIDNAENLIDDVRWKEKILYLKGIWYLVEFDDEQSSYSCIESIDIEKCYDPEILTLYLQVKPGKIPYKKSEEIINRIIENTKQESVKLQYRVLAGINLFIIFETKEACRVIADAIVQYERLEPSKKSVYGDLQYARALETLGNISNNQEVLENCKKAVESLISQAYEAKYKSGFIEDLYKILGDVENGLGNYELAIDAYKKCSSDLNNIFLARVYCNFTNIDKAKEVLNSINIGNLDVHGKFDLALAWALIALNTFEKKDIELAKSLLKNVKTDQPYFINLRDKQLLELLEAKPKDKNTITKVIKKLNEYITLNPNIFGVGVNINKIIEDLDN
jgi:hypothetical protein